MEITWNGTVTSGILQGSILGLILFVKFINDLLECILSEVLCFTNDTKLFSDIRTEDNVETLYNMTWTTTLTGMLNRCYDSTLQT